MMRDLTEYIDHCVERWNTFGFGSILSHTCLILVNYKIADYNSHLSLLILPKWTPATVHPCEIVRARSLLD